MFIKDQTFKDEDTLLEMLFDFSIGDASPLLKKMIADIDVQLQNNEAYIKYRDSLTDEDDKIELYTEERDLILAEELMKQYDSFAVHDKKLYAINGASKDLLYEVDFI